MSDEKTRRTRTVKPKSPAAQAARAMDMVQESELQEEESIIRVRERFVEKREAIVSGLSVEAKAKYDALIST